MRAARSTINEIAGQNDVPSISELVRFFIASRVIISNKWLMKLNKNIGMILLALYLILDSLLGFGLNIGPAVFLLYLVGLAAAIFILIGK